MNMNLTSSEKIENMLTTYFQKNIKMSINGELYKKGKFILISNSVLASNYFFEFYIEKEKKIDTVKIPFPFKWEEYKEDNLILFDYRISSLINNKYIVDSLKTLAQTSYKEEKSKLLDNILEIEFN